jgi:phage terminase large subunit-like protein
LSALPNFTPEQLQALSHDELMELVQLTEQLKYITETHRLEDYRPYPKQREFHAAGATHRERLLMAGNQLGKTLAAAMEVAMHMTGRYPDWWEGYRFDRPTRGICGSESVELTKKGVQRLLLGNPETPEQWGTGSIPKDCLIGTSPRPGVPNAVSAIVVKHVSGGESVLTTASYDQGRTKWQADTLDWAWLDEECDEDIYFEVLTRTNVVMGPVFMTFTPLQGMSNVVRRFYPRSTAAPGTHVTHMTIDDAEHYTPEQRAAIIASYPEHERKARAMGLPALGSGRVFQVDQDEITCNPFSIPSHWPQICGLDFGWDHPTAAARLAWDRDNDILYVTQTYRRRQVTPLIFASAVRPWGDWLPWAWPHDGLQHDKGSGEQLAKQYAAAGLRMLATRATFEDGTNGLEAGVQEMNDRMLTGRLKVFAHLDEWFEEFNMYHRKDGLIVKEADDILSATRYAMMMRRFAIPQAKPGVQRPVQVPMPGRNGQAWMG